MTTHSVDTERRRSQRMPLSVLLFVMGLDPPFTFQGQLYTVQVNDHGCLISALRPFPHGSRVHLDLLSSNPTTTAHVVHSVPAEIDVQIWNVALELDTPGKFWTPPSSVQHWLATA